MSDDGHHPDRYRARVNLASLDLNLLVSLDALLQERSVTRAAARMGLSQPALSASLARLRRHFGDELLTRVGNEYRLTPLAVQLRELARLALSRRGAGVRRPDRVRPGELQPRVHVARQRLRRRRVRQHDRAAARRGGAARPPAAHRQHPVHGGPRPQILLTTDLLVLPHGFVTDLSHRDLYRDEWVCVVSADNPVVGEGLTTEHLETLPWVVTFHGPTAATPAARQMRMRGIEPNVAVITENFLTVPGLVAGSGRIALLQRRLVDLLPLDVGLRALPPPVEVGQLVEAMWWHPVYDDDPEHAYLRDVVVRATRQALGEAEVST